jgi:phage terminase small subunit
MAERTTAAIRLSPKEEGFCVAILAGRNPSDAYRVTYQPKRAKAKTIHEMASRLMAKHKVRARLAELMRPVIERAQLTREEWLEGLARICLADVRKMFDEDGNPIPITKLADCEAAAIAALEVYGGLAASSDVSEARGRTLRVRTVDQLKALELYGKAMGYFAEQREINNNSDCNRPTITVEFVEPVPMAVCAIETVTAAPASSSA